MLYMVPSCENEIQLKLVKAPGVGQAKQSALALMRLNIFSLLLSSYDGHLISAYTDGGHRFPCLSVHDPVITFA